MEIKPIDGWSFFNTSYDTRLTGKLLNGSTVLTTEILYVRGRFVKTRNSLYYLEEADPAYLSLLDLPGVEDIKLVLEQISNKKFEVY